MCWNSSPCRLVTTRQCDPASGRSLTVACCEAIGEALDDDPLDLAPLYEHIDLEAASSLFPAEPSDRMIQFSVDDMLVSIHGRGEVRVCDISVEA